MFHIHKWTGWTPVEANYRYGGWAVADLKTCTKCGKRKVKAL